MPFPWKKNKVKRISKLVADLQSPKRGGSLVVETGFPTSLIDLVVKNRERFEKTRTKKSGRVPDPDPDPVRQNAPTPPLPSPTTMLSLNRNCHVVSPVLDQMDHTETENLSSDVGVSVEDQNRVEESGSGTDPVSIFISVLKIVTVVGLALSTKKLTVGITTSAFLLLFLEYVGRRFGFYLKPCSVAKTWTKSLAQRVSNFFLFRKFVMLWKRIKISESEIIVSQFVVASSSSVSEIEVLETRKVAETKVDEDVSGEINEIDLSDGVNVLDCLEVKESERKILEECEDCVSRNKLKLNAKLNSMLIKKFVPKKWRSAKKGRKNAEKKIPDLSSSDQLNLDEDLSGKSDEHETQYETEHRGQDDGVRTKFPISEIGECREEQQTKENTGIACSNGLLLQASQEVDVNFAREGNAGYVILFLLVLAGLLLGRVVALILVMTWCGVLKFVERSRSSAKISLLVMQHNP